MLFIFYTYQIPISFPANFGYQWTNSRSSLHANYAWGKRNFHTTTAPVCARLVKLSIVN